MLLPRERKIIVLLLLMTFISMIFETLGIGLIIPAVGLLTRPDYVTQFQLFQIWSVMQAGQTSFV